MDFLIANASNIESILIICGAIIGGFMYFFGGYSKSNQELTATSMQAAQNLIDTYKQTIEVQNEKIKVFTETEIAQGKEIAHLQGQVKVLTDMVALRDPGTKSVFEAAPAAFAAITVQGQAIEKLTATLQEFLTKVNDVLESK